LPTPNSPETGVQNPQVLPPKPEAIFEPGHNEARPNFSTPSENAASPVQIAPTLPSPTPQQKTTVAIPPLRPLTPADDNPAIAADEEVIEKEWVDKAKKIVILTKNDPYQQEKEVSKLQADYLKKRYGKDIKTTND